MSRPADVILNMTWTSPDGWGKPSTMETICRVGWTGKGRGTLHADGSVTLGKAEAEWCWPEGFEAFKAACLIDYTIKGDTIEWKVMPYFHVVSADYDLYWQERRIEREAVPSRVQGQPKRRAVR